LILRLNQEIHPPPLHVHSADRTQRHLTCATIPGPIIPGFYAKTKYLSYA
jgi:hypothetical protein